jgi:hypothetical protein
LTRGNVELLRQIGDLALNDEGLASEGADALRDSPRFSEIEEAVGLSRLAAVDTEDEESSDADDAGESDGARGDASNSDDWKRYSTEQNRQLGMTSFDSPIVSRAMTVLRKSSLVSIVVRSSERIEDQELKRDIVKAALQLWSVTFDELWNDETLNRGLSGAISRAIVAGHEDSVTDQQEQLRREKGLKNLLLGLVVMSGVISDLASSKLAKALRHVLNSGDLDSDILARTLGAIALAESSRLHEPEWLNELRKTYSDAGKKTISRELIFAYLLLVVGKLQPGHEANEDIFSFIADLALDAAGNTGPAVRSTEKSRIMKRIKRRLESK